MKTVSRISAAVNGLQNYVTPINRMPSEIFYHILDHLDTSSNPKDSDALKCSHVCGQWRDLAIAHSHLWSKIYITSRKSDLLSECLRRSKNAPLMVTVDIATIYPHNLFPVYHQMLQLSAHAPRITSMCIEVVHVDVAQMLNKALDFPMPNLRTLEYRCRALITPPGFPIAFGGHLSQLRKMKLHAFQAWDPKIFTGLTHVVLGEIRGISEVDFMLDFLERNPALESLEVRRPIGGRVEAARLVTLDHLKRIVFSKCQSRLLLGHLSLPANVELHTDERNIVLFPPNHSKLLFLHNIVEAHVYANAHEFSLEAVNSEGGSFTSHRCLYGIQQLDPVSFHRVQGLELRVGYHPKRTEHFESSHPATAIEEDFDLLLWIPDKILLESSPLKTIRLFSSSWQKSLLKLHPSESILFPSLERVDILITQETYEEVFMASLQLARARAAVGVPLRIIPQLPLDGENLVELWNKLCEENQDDTLLVK